MMWGIHHSFSRGAVLPKRVRLLPGLMAALIAAAIASCGTRETSVTSHAQHATFDPGTLKIPDEGGRKVRGQVLYMPIYSNIPFYEKEHYDLSAFLAVHNADLNRTIRITKVVYFDTEGRVVRHFIEEDRTLKPFGTAVFAIPQQDQSGTGANFLVEWVSEQPVTAPLVESVMKDLAGGRGISFLSTGRIIREMP